MKKPARSTDTEALNCESIVPPAKKSPAPLTVVQRILIEEAKKAREDKAKLDDVQGLTNSQVDRIVEQDFHLRLKGNRSAREYVAYLKSSTAKNPDGSFVDWIPDASTLFRWGMRKNLSKSERAGDYAAVGRTSNVKDGPLTAFFCFKTNCPELSNVGILKLMRDMKESEGWDELQAPRVFERWWQRASGSLRAMLTAGSRERYEKFGLVIRLDDPEPNAVWRTDSKEFSCYAFDFTGETREACRPWVTSFQDVGSRLITGTHVTRKAQNRTGPLIALKKAIKAFGKPGIIISDNGSIFKCDDFRRACIELGITLMHTHKYCPSEAGRIEIWHRLIEEEFVAPFQTQSLPKVGDRPSVKYQVLWPKFPDLFSKWKIQFNGSRPHSGLGGRTPMDVWSEKFATSFVPVDAKKVDESVVVRSSHKVSREGVELIKGRHWKCEAFTGMVGRVVTVSCPPEGPSYPVRAYRKSEFIGELTNITSEGKLTKLLRSKDRDLVKVEREICKVLNIQTAASLADRQEVKDFEDAHPKRKRAKPTTKKAAPQPSGEAWEMPETEEAAE